jgi:hypothetical protein
MFISLLPQLNFASLTFKYHKTFKNWRILYVPTFKLSEKFFRNYYFCKGGSLKNFQCGLIFLMRAYSGQIPYVQ